MNEAIIKRLNDLNREFYRVTAASFDRTRDQPWPGWERLLPFLHTPLSALDVGCGNGRFGRFLVDRLKDVRYHGLDNSPALLAFARTELDGCQTRLDEHDILTQPLPNERYDLVTLFGVLHHIPGAQQRHRLIRDLAACTAPGGLLVFTSWRFFEVERFRRRIIPWPEDLRDAVEPHDYLLDWQRDVIALRYCHYVNDAEHAALVSASGLTLIATFRADGHTDDLNCYSLLRRESVP